MKFLLEIIPNSRLLHSDDILARESGREVHEVGGLMRLLHSFIKRLSQSDDFLAREGGREVHEVGGLMRLLPYYKATIFLPGRVGGRFMKLAD